MWNERKMIILIVAVLLAIFFIGFYYFRDNISSKLPKAGQSSSRVIKLANEGGNVSLSENGYIIYRKGNSTVKLKVPDGWSLDDTKENVSEEVYLRSNINAESNNPVGNLHYYVWFVIGEEIEFDKNIVDLEDSSFKNTNGDLIRAYSASDEPSRFGELSYFVELDEGRYLAIALDPYDPGRVKPFENQDEALNAFMQILKSIEF